MIAAHRRRGAPQDGSERSPVGGPVARPRRCGVGTVAEFQATAHEPYFSGSMVNPLMKPAGIGARVSKQYDSRAFEGGDVALLCPTSDFFAIWRIAKDDVRTPVLREPIVLLGEELWALGILRRGTRVQTEMEFIVEEFEEVGRGRPLFGAAGVERFVYH
jgi:hypothetical protein